MKTQQRQGRSQRADARRNRDLIISAAADLFRTEGMTLQMDTVAQRAGVGVGTVYRHFPTKEALLAELVFRRMETLVSEAEAALAGHDPASGVRAFILGVACMMDTDAGLVQALGASVGDSQTHTFDRKDLMERKRAVLARAQAEGLLRSDLQAEDFDGLLCGLGAAIQSGADPVLMANTILDGLHVPWV